MNLELRFEPPSSSRWRSWWQSRLIPSDTHALTLHNVYVLPTKAGWMMLVTIAVLMLATINYQLNLGYVLIFLLMGAGVIGLYMAHRAMTRTVLSLDTSRALHGIAGEDVEVAIQITQNNTESVSRIQHLTTQFDAIGQQPLPLVTCETRYPLGLLRLWTVWRIESEAYIDAPKMISSAAATSNDPAPIDPIKDDFRAYRVGDAPRDLLWKSVAKRPDSPASWGVRARDTSAAQMDALTTARYAALQPPPTENKDQQGLQAMLQKRDQLLLCALLLIGLPFFLHLAPWYPLMATMLICIRLWLTTTAKAQSPKWLQLPLIVGLGLLLWFQFRTFNGIEPSVSACLGLLGIKALELPAPQLPQLPQLPRSSAFSRDRWVLVFLGLFTLAAHFLMSQSLLSSAFVVLGLASLLYVLVDAHSHARQIKTTATLVFLGAPIMLVLFFLFPRFAPLWTLTQQKTTAITGLSSEMRVGDISQITLDNRIIFRFELDPPARLAGHEIYLRGPVLPDFDGRTWRSYQRSPAPAPVLLDYPLEPVIGYTKIEDGKRTRATSLPWLRHAPPSTSPAYLQAALRLPLHSNPRTRHYLQGLQQTAQFQHLSPRQISEWVLALFRTGGYRYSLEPGSYGEHSTDELLFDRKLGFCEHYAASYVIAMRMLGVPARIVTGYQGAELTSEPNLWVVRNRHAHAWAEYWDAQLGWIRADPTAVIAPARIQNQEAFNQSPEQIAKRSGAAWATPWLSPVLAQLWRARQQWDAGSYAWEQWMQNYNQSAQLSMLKRLGFDNPSWKDLVQLLDSALIALLAIAAALCVLKGKRRADPWLALLAAARNEATKAGAVLMAHATPQEIALQLPQTWPNRSNALAWLMRLERARYQHASAKQAVNTELATLKRSFKADFRAPS